MNPRVFKSTKFAVLVLSALLGMSVSAAAAELIHFDCVNDGSEVTPDRPHTDLFNDPPNNLQCLADGASVLGNGTVHPKLEIISPNGHRVIKTQSVVSNIATFIAPNDYSAKNNCFEFLDEPRREVGSHETSGAWGFGDATACHSNGCDKDVDRQALDFVFHDVTVSEFSLRMLDWGDYRFSGEKPAHFQVLLAAYDKDNNLVDTFNYHFTLEERSPYQNGYQTHEPYECFSEADNSCYGRGEDLWSNGDACVADEGQPGYLSLSVAGHGITHVELRMPSKGFDPNVGFDSIRFTPE